MSYYTRDTLPPGPVLGARKTSINEFFLSAYTLSIYAGCEFGCPYCDSWAFSPRPINEAIRVPMELPQRLADELRSVHRGDLVGITALSDAYQPAERSYRLTRQVLQALANNNQPCMVMTKSPTILEDVGLLQQINQQSLAIALITIPTLDEALAAKLEGKAPPPAERLALALNLKQAGIPVGVAVLPIMPYVSDSDVLLRNLLRGCAEAGVDFVVWDYLHIPHERHLIRINEVLARVGWYPASYYRDLYIGKPYVNSHYRKGRDWAMLNMCDGLGLEVCAPHSLFAGKLRPANEAALLLKHAAIRDNIHGRQNLARLHRSLADRIYNGDIPTFELNASPLKDEVLALFNA
ncbi:MAG: radical SAM protein [Chloroflexaceae bacterium]|jgi:DNA repair photolyase|nr:radical SAM protein [Chloroflexaceae bacterium]